MCGSMVDPDTKLLVDVGTDHAYLPIYLVEKGIVNFSIAVDRLEGPLLNAKKKYRKTRVTRKSKNSSFRWIKES